MNEVDVILVLSCMKRHSIYMYLPTAELQPMAKEPIISSSKGRGGGRERERDRERTQIHVQCT